MLKNEDIICISSIDWDFIWQGHQEIMSTFAQAGNRVLFIENTGVRPPTLRDLSRIRKRLLNWSKGIGGIRKENENLYIFSPLVIPFPYSRLARWINRHLLLFSLHRWMRAIDFNNPIIWAFLPTGLTLDLINYINKKATVYYCIDNFAVSSSLAHKIRQTEQKLISQADIVFVTAKRLYDYCSKYNPKVYSFPFGVSMSYFEQLSPEKSGALSDLQGIKEPIIGYVGGIHKWIDQGLVRRLAELCPDYSFVFVGPVQTDISSLSNMKNIYFLGNKTHHQLPYYISRFRAGIIPYLITEYTKNVYPTKLNEYLALARPVVSTDLPEIKAFNEKYNDVILVGKDEWGFAGCLEQVINSRDDAEAIENRIQIARQGSWRNKIEQMSELIEQVIESRIRNKGLLWRESLLRFYRTGRRRLVKSTLALALIYFLLFQTPLLWSFASFLKMSQQPQQADAIVVFGGGVGEGGSPGKSTIERARFAAELYKAGYANRVIFSSGYIYKYNDAENMKFIALSAGIPEKNIILEQRANSTYENAKYTKEIIDKHYWRKILLVSSPYNMRRAALSFKTLDSDLRIIYTPVPQPQFYATEGKMGWRQFKAIMHEYLGIIYYWWRGWI